MNPKILNKLEIDPQKLKAARGERPIQEVAKILGITRQQMWNYEAGERLPPANKLLRLCVLYGIDIADLVKNREKFLLAS